MDINRIDRNAKLRLYETSSKEKDAAKITAESNKNTANKTSGNDKITISSQAKNLNVIDFAKSKVKYEMITDLSDFYANDKILALKAQIKNGEYMINSKDIAAALVSGGYGV